MSLAPSMQAAYARTFRCSGSFVGTIHLVLVGLWQLRQCWPIVYMCMVWVWHSLLRVCSRLAAIAFTTKSVDFPDPYKDFRVRKALKSWDRAGPKIREPRLPVFLVMWQQLTEVFITCGLYIPWAFVIQGSFSTGLFLSIQDRVLVASSKLDTSGHALGIQDKWPLVLVIEGEMMVRTWFSKADRMWVD